MPEIQSWGEMESSGEYDGYGSMAREFAKRHVMDALKEASENVDYTTDGQEHITDVWIDKDSILNSYPLNKIK